MNPVYYGMVREGQYHSGVPIFIPQSGFTPPPGPIPQSYYHSNGMFYPPLQAQQTAGPSSYNLPPPPLPYQQMDSAMRRTPTPPRTPDTVHFTLRPAPVVSPPIPARVKQFANTSFPMPPRLKALEDRFVCINNKMKADEHKNEFQKLASQHGIEVRCPLDNIDTNLHKSSNISLPTTSREGSDIKPANSKQQSQRQSLNLKDLRTDMKENSMSTAHEKKMCKIDGKHEDTQFQNEVQPKETEIQNKCNTGTIENIQTDKRIDKTRDSGLVNYEKTAVSDSETNEKTAVSDPETNKKTAGSDPETNEKTAVSDPKTNEKTAVCDPETNKKTAGSDPETNEKTAVSDPETNKKTAGSDPETNEKTAVSDPKTNEKTAVCDLETNEHKNDDVVDENTTVINEQLEEVDDRLDDDCCDIEIEEHAILSDSYKCLYTDSDCDSIEDGDGTVEVTDHLKSEEPDDKLNEIVSAKNASYEMVTDGVSLEGMAAIIVKEAVSKALSILANPEACNQNNNRIIETCHENENTNKVDVQKDVSNLSSGEADENKKIEPRGRLYSWNYTDTNTSDKIQKEHVELELDKHGVVMNECLKDTTENDEDFESFDFRQRASQCGIRIAKSKTTKTKPSHCREDYKDESKEWVTEKEKVDMPFPGAGDSDTFRLDRSCSMYKHRMVLRSQSEDSGSDVYSLEGSQSDPVDDFKVKASRRGIKIVDPNESTDITTESDTESDISHSKLSRSSTLDSLRGHRVSTPDSLNPDVPEFIMNYPSLTSNNNPNDNQRKSQGTLLNPDSIEFKPRFKQTKRQQDFIESSFTDSDLNNSLDSSMRAEAPAFIPGVRESVLVKENSQQKPTASKKARIFHLSSPKGSKSNSIATQASPTITDSCVGTRRVKTKDSAVSTNACETRDVCINTLNADNVEGVVIMPSRPKLVSKSTTTQVLGTRSVGVNVKFKIPVKSVEKSDASTMVNLDNGSQNKNERDLLEKIKCLQVELMTCREKQAITELQKRKDILIKQGDSLVSYFTDRNEFEVFSGLIQNKISLIERNISFIEVESQRAKLQISSGAVLDQLPDFDKFLHPTGNLQSVSTPMVTTASNSYTPPLYLSPKTSGTSPLTQNGKSPISGGHSPPLAFVTNMNPNCSLFQNSSDLPSKTLVQTPGRTCFSSKLTSPLRNVHTSPLRSPNVVETVDSTGQVQFVPAGQNFDSEKDKTNTVQYHDHSVGKTDQGKLNTATEELEKAKSDDISSKGIKQWISQKMKEEYSTEKSADTNVQNLSVGIPIQTLKSMDSIDSEEELTSDRLEPEDVKDELQKDEINFNESEKTSDQELADGTMATIDEKALDGESVVDSKSVSDAFEIVNEKEVRDGDVNKSENENMNSLETSSDGGEDKIDEENWTKLEDVQVRNQEEKTACINMEIKQGDSNCDNVDVNGNSKTDIVGNMKYQVENVILDGKEILVGTGNSNEVVVLNVKESVKENLSAVKEDEAVNENRNNMEVLISNTKCEDVNVEEQEYLAGNAKYDEVNSKEKRKKDNVCDTKCEEADLMVQQQELPCNEKKKSEEDLNVKENSQQSLIDNSNCEYLNEVIHDKNLLYSTKKENRNEDLISDPEMKDMNLTEHDKVDLSRNTKDTAVEEVIANKKEMGESSTKEPEIQNGKPSANHDQVCAYDSKEIFMSPKTHAEGFLDSNPSQTSEVMPNMNFMPEMAPTALDPLSMMGNFDPILFQAVMAQLIQAYPELASNQVMLTNVAMQQTSLLQMYMKDQQQSGDTGHDNMNPLPSIVNSASNPNMHSASATDLTTSISDSLSNYNKINDAIPGTTTPSTSSVSCASNLISSIKTDTTATKQVSSGHGNVDTWNSLGNASASPVRKLKPPGISHDIFITDDDSPDLDKYDERKSNQGPKKGGDQKATPSLGVGQNQNKVKSRTSNLDDFDDLEDLTQYRNKLDILDNFSDLRPDLSQKASHADSDTKFQMEIVKPQKQQGLKTRKDSGGVQRVRKNSSSSNREEPSIDGTSLSSQTKGNELNNKEIFSQNIPPRFRKKSGTTNSKPPGPQNFYVPPAKRNPIQKDTNPVCIKQTEDWDAEAEEFPETFVLQANPSPTLTMKKKHDTNSDWKPNVTEKVFKPSMKQSIGSGSSNAEMCDIPPPKVTKTDSTTATDQSAQEEQEQQWCEVTTKRKRPKGKEQPGTIPTQVFIGTKKSQKMSNFEKLVSRLLEEFPGSNRQSVIDAVGKIRTQRGSLSGLNMESIIERAHLYIEKPKQIPGLPPAQGASSQKNVLNMPVYQGTSASKMVMKMPPCPQGISAPKNAGKLTDLHKSGPFVNSTGCEDDEDICVICHDVLSIMETKELDCNHVYHYKCISQWVERERTCPTCRKHALFPEDFPRLGK